MSRLLWGSAHTPHPTSPHLTSPHTFPLMNLSPVPEFFWSSTEAEKKQRLFPLGIDFAFWFPKAAVALLLLLLFLLLRHGKIAVLAAVKEHNQLLRAWLKAPGWTNPGRDLSPDTQSTSSTESCSNRPALSASSLAFCWLTRTYHLHFAFLQTLLSKSQMKQKLIQAPSR